MPIVYISSLFLYLRLPFTSLWSKPIYDTLCSICIQLYSLSICRTCTRTVICKKQMANYNLSMISLLIYLRTYQQRGVQLIWVGLFMQLIIMSYTIFLVDWYHKNFCINSELMTTIMKINSHWILLFFYFYFAQKIVSVLISYLST